RRRRSAPAFCCSAPCGSPTVFACSPRARGMARRCPSKTPRAESRLVLVRCTVTLLAEGGGIVARCREYPECVGRAPNASEALEQLRRSVLFWLESCPCDQTADPGLVLEVVEDRSGSTPRPR